ncbi:ABC transporter ATP-binding protein [Paenibacillus sp. N3.4]|uniref:ABC transporter ATP-binding protein n=1 Tax=Paenibacillus sp. N3.4 TaxID=2603222 RepID=UPI001C9C0D6A|nr:ABC transporter ATP-binding protein [Paenibacillus sp. N3.4]
MNSLKMYIRLIRYVNPRWWLTGLAFSLTMLCLLFDLLQPFLISRFIDKVLIGKQVDWLVPILGSSLAITIVSAVLTVIGFSIFRYLEARNTLDLRSTVLRHIRQIPLTEIEKNGVGKYMALMGIDTSTTSKFINVLAVELTRQWLQMLVSLVIIFIMDWRLGLVALCSIPFVMGIPRLYRRPIKDAVNRLRTHNEEIGTYLFESIQGSREIRTYGLEEWEEQRNELIYKDLVRVSIREGMFRQLSGRTGSLVIAITVALLYGFGSGQVMAGVFTVGMMVAAVQYIQAVLNPIQNMNYLISDLLGSEASMSRIEEFLHTPTEAHVSLSKSEPEMPSARDSALQTAAALEVVKISPYVEERQPFISCRDLYVSYEGVSILKGVTIEVTRGQVAAFVGRSGSGKSTLFKTLQGFMPVDAGDVRIGHNTLAGWSRQAISRQISFVSQESFLFKGMLFDNVRLGKLDATEDEVYEALCEVDLKSFVDNLPDGMYTKLDNQGFQLSGGQRQRVAIARAIIKKPDILILDEPTSALDRNTEEQVLSTIYRIMKNKTVLISTHKLESIASADIIYVMEQGTVIDSGTHDVLMTRCGTYMEMVKHQELLQIV